MILAAFHLAARRDRSMHQKQEPSAGYVSISCDVAKCRQSAPGPVVVVQKVVTVAYKPPLRRSTYSFRYFRNNSKLMSPS